MCSSAAERSQEELLFLKKKKQKDFHPFGRAPTPQAKRIKVFWFFFSKKNALPC
ncbi:MAG: hypothetical protein IT555_18595 [Acetobacteraceae bacterium]|nr:hypothetical protein [Acetobacteraceae bacterium]